MDLFLNACKAFTFTNTNLQSLQNRGFTFKVSKLDESELEIASMSFHAKNSSNTVSLELINLPDEEAFKRHPLGQLPEEHNLVLPRLHLGTASQTEMGVMNWGFPCVIESPSLAAPFAIHPNTTLSVAGIYLGPSNLFPSSVRFLDGTMLFAEETFSFLKPYFSLRKECPFWAVVLECQNMQTFLKSSQPDDLVNWQSRPMAHIKLGPNLWDLLVIESVSI